MSFAYDHERDLLRVSTTTTRARAVNLRRDPRATMLAVGPNRWSYAVAEVRAELLPVATTTDDASVAELVAIYRALVGEHPDWDDFARAMVAESRLPPHLHVERVYGAPPAG